MRTINTFTRVLLILIFSHGYCNAQKNHTKHIADSLWTKDIFLNKISPKGDWVFFNELDNRMVRKYKLLNAQKNIDFEFNEIRKPEFTETQFIYLNNKKDLTIKDLKQLKDYKYANCLGYLLNNTKTIVAINYKDSSVLINLEDYSVIAKFNGHINNWNPKSTIFSLTTNEEGSDYLKLIQLKNSGTYIIFSKSVIDLNWQEWDDNGESLFFSEKDLITNYNIHSKKSIEKQLNNSFDTSNLNLQKPIDGKYVYFNKKVNNSNANQSMMEVWEGRDKWIFPRKNEYEKNEKFNFLYQWDSEKNVIKQLTDTVFSSYITNPRFNNSIVYNKLQYEPEFFEFPFSDLYLKTHDDNSQTLIAQHIYTKDGYFNFSIKGNYIVYFDQKDWWLYHVKTKTKRNLTQNIQAKFFSEWVDGATLKLPYSRFGPIWSDDEKFLMIYSQYDIWLFNTENNSHEKITNSGDTKTRYRIFNDFNLVANGGSINPKDYIYLKVSYENHSSSWATWKKGKGLKLHDKLKGNIDYFFYQNNQIYFKLSKFNLSPIIYNYNLQNNLRVVYETNKELKNLHIKDEELVYYDVPINNERLKGALLYPFNYNPDKKYPLIVSVYERNSESAKLFDPPSFTNYTGFNVLNLLWKEYFILLPDIVYLKNNPGKAATVSLEAALDKVFENKSIDKNRVGLIGHSFGGYQTGIVITQSNYFKTSVIGSTTIDLVTYYHDISWSMKKEQMWRIENQQFRMSPDFYKFKQDYINNSTLYHLDRINTPVLIWTGKEDDNANWYQNTYLYTGLRRLNKPVKMLLFNKEGHSIFEPINQKLLTIEIENWFDKYLK